MERVRIPNEATYLPFALTDVILAAPLASRLLLGATLPGRVIQTAALGVYAASALQDWAGRRGVRRVEFLEAFGADLHHLQEMPRAVREEELRTLVGRLNDLYQPRRIPREEAAAEVDRHLTGYIAGITGQHVETSNRVRNFSIAKLVFPFALGACDFLSGDIAIFRDTGIFEPHVIAHEFCHRKGYLRELEAQALAYLALTASGEPVFVQAALAERLHRNLSVLAGDEEGKFQQLVARAGLREELRAQFDALRPPLDPMTRRVFTAMKALYNERMRLTGQNGIQDYDEGFTNFLYTLERNPAARHPPTPAGRLR